MDKNTSKLEQTGMEMVKLRLQEEVNFCLFYVKSR